ncbi:MULTISPECIES: branched-chain amino acid ABC transporter permease [unclassified Acidisoma]|uniref:branched-chain amino acid ABC transporter permease n=1 Tax=unclassified Acidisoma TaxID=2634065 RepID=UPI00131E6854|nr:MULTISPECIES: branched-chain amino acid ABC transporter permease [unclassified Acidisoma]
MFSSANAIQVTLGGLATGSLYAVILFGIILVFQVSRSINFAYGPTGMLGTFASYALYSEFGLPVWFAVLIGIGVTVLIAALTDLLIIRRLPPQQGFDVVVTLGELLFLTALAQLVFGASAQSYLKLLTDVPVLSRNIFVNGNDVLAVVLGVAVAIGGYFVLNSTSLGVSLRAAAADPSVAQSVGINVRGLRTAAWAVSGVFVAVGAMMFAARLSVNAFYMTPIVINVFIAGMIGGLDRYWPPMLSAFGIALYQSWAMYLFGEAGGVPALFILVIVILAAVPKRLLDERHEARA